MRNLERRTLLSFARSASALGIFTSLLITLATAASGQADLRSGQTSGAVESSRIISIGGDITEILYAIGADKRIVAVDATSQFPPEALKEKKNIGYMRALSTEGVLSVAGDIIIASDRAGPPEVIKALKASPVTYVEIADEFSPSSIAAKMRQIARAVSLEAAGNELAARIERDFDNLAELRKQIRQPMRVLFVLNVVNGRATVGGSHSSADAILKLAGAENAAASVNGYKPISDEALVAVRPDAIVAMRRTESGSHDANQIASLIGLKGSPAVRNKRIIHMNGLYLLGFGPRAPAAALDLMRSFYPELAGLGK